MSFRAGTALLAVAAVACRAPRPCPAVPSTAVELAPRRDHCLAPPWVVDPARPESGAAGWSAAACPDASGSYVDAADRTRRNAYFIHDGTRAISGTEAKSLLDELRAYGNSSGLGGCCSPRAAREAHVICLQFWSNVCSTPMSRIVQAVDRELARRGLETVRLGVDIAIDGPVGPRCEASDPTCGPVSSREWERPDAPGPSPAGCVAGRVRLAEAHEVTSGRACVHDGECMVGGCGADCLRWDQLPGMKIWCEGVVEPGAKKPLVNYCGCVAGRCDWFRPVAP